MLMNALRATTSTRCVEDERYVGWPVSWRKLDSYSSKEAAIARRDELIDNGWPRRRVRIV
jgi:hypothetical protein